MTRPSPASVPTTGTPALVILALAILTLCAACAAGRPGFDWGKYQPPDWRRYQARVHADATSASPTGSTRQSDPTRVTFSDLKHESDQSLARRLLGAVGQRIAYIDRHRDRWRYYGSDNDPAESLDFYTHPDALGSQYGLCGTEKYVIAFDDSGHVSAVAVATRYGVEGPIFQKPDFDWDYYRNVMCKAAAVSHAPSYFPAPDSITAHHAAMLLIPTIDLARAPASLPYRLRCHGWRRPCSSNIREYLATLRLDDIDEFDLRNCPSDSGPKQTCFTITTGQYRLGPFPKTITVKGSTYMNDPRVDSVEIEEDFTIS